MKKGVIYFMIFIVLFFLLPVFLTKQKNITKEVVQEEVSQDKEEKINEYQYKEYGKIKLLHIATNEIEEIDIDDYLVNVVSAEMPADYEEEALKAQAIVARTYTIYQINNHKHEGADICDSSACCQAWISKEDRLARWENDISESNWKKITKCVNETKGKIITYNNEPINAFFHSNSGGKTETPGNVWGGSNEGYPYLKAVDTAGEDEYHQYSSQITYTNEELLNKLKEKYDDISIDFNKDEEILITEYTDSGRVKTVRFGNHNLSGVEARTVLGLKSTNFEILKNENNISFNVIGYGHGVGMSQTGANTLAKQNWKCEDIIKHFYTGVEIKEI